MKTYITFGQDHRHEVNGKIFDKDCVAEIECTDHEDGRNKAFEAFGPTFAFSYTDLDQVGMHYYHRGLVKLDD